jgi:hypothetical protein
LNRRQGGPQSRSGGFGEDINLLTLTGFKPRTLHPVVYSGPRLEYKTEDNLEFFSINSRKSVVYTPAFVLTQDVVPPVMSSTLWCSAEVPECSQSVLRALILLS